MLESLCNWLAKDASGILFTLFVCLALGYAIGKLRLGVLSLGATVGTLLMGVVVSALVGKYATYDIPSILRSAFFYLFIFALGYDVGPSFAKSLKTSGLRLIIMAVIFTLVELAIGIACYYLLHLGNGELIGLFAGSATQSSILGAAQTMMPAFGITGEAATAMNTQMTASYACGYLISYAGCVIFIKCVMPYVAGCKGVNGLKAEVKKEIEKNGGAQTETQRSSLFNHIRMRTFRVGPQCRFANQTVEAFEQGLGGRVMVETLMTDSGVCADFDARTPLAPGSVVALIGELDKIATLDQTPDGLEEVTDAQYQKVAVTKQKVVVSKALTAEDQALLFSEHVMISDAERNGKPVALDAIKQGDAITILGSSKYIQKVVQSIGYAVDSGDDTNVTFMSAGMLVGILIGVLSISIAGVPIGLGTSGGLILLGILCGWYNDKKPGKGYISAGARWFMKSVGLNLFVGCLGLSSGATFISAVAEMGLPMILAIVIMSFLPHVLTVLIAKYTLKLSPVELLGGTCGAGTNTAALNALSDETGSSIFAASYTPAYAMANITLTFLGLISISLFH